MSEWSIDDNALLRVYEAIDVDWERDLVFAFNKHHNPHEKILRFFEDRDRLAEHRVYSAGRYVLDVAEALKLQTRFNRERRSEKKKYFLRLIYYIAGRFVSACQTGCT